MSLFEWLLVGHLVGDYLLQTRWMADNKADNLVPLLMHCSIYTAAVTALSLLKGGISPVSIALILVSHIFLDKRFFVKFWTLKVTRSEDSAWLKVMVDQSWHIIILAVVSLIQKAV